MNDKKDVLDNGPFFHGTKAELKIGVYRHKDGFCY